MIKIFHLFKGKNEIENEGNVLEQVGKKDETRNVLEDAEANLREIEEKVCHINDRQLFIRLLFFTAYYSFIIGFYKDNIERILSVRELLLLKYIPMIKDILDGFDENNAEKLQQQELKETLSNIDEKLYDTIKNIKEQQELDLNIDLKTIQDLIQSDF
ncbi:hypothetical protein [Marinisporobacter balticus]|uniref:hypothetical protein n=1 Tax=Marinisporobacter balticus TaxID=2018667 RepID=UPI001404E992|nr:hypothetical protein [Marinisporobacter balticus]